ncbi:conserved Plasmodium protein, unknown function [Plasmodium malariae]|uniref:Uncharacterized protein n=1 Tax=Plasmodium malariae TaxID=5858 RepID=A0A1D3PAB2_PLAMA|nr:conserved Plasmodium protein, unknown function [Plasmodium malariae]SCN12169.1 conserved Plasmodium protein, unknown function [Plasmodium malariae]
MNKENTKKLISIINVLDKLSEHNEGKDESCHKLKSFFSSEFSKTYDSLENEKSLFPLYYEKDKLDSNVNKIINEIKTTKSFFYFNKSNSQEKEESENSDKKYNTTKSCHLNDGGEIYNKEYNIDENINNSYEHFNGTSLDIMNSAVLGGKESLKKTNYTDKINKTFSSSYDEFSFIKLQTGSFMSKRNSLNMFRNYFSDTELLSFNNCYKKKRNLKRMLRKRETVKCNNVKLNVNSIKKSEFIANPKKYKTIRGNMDEGLDEYEYLDHNDIGQLLEKILEHLNINLKKTINKLNKTNYTLNNKLETAVENNDEQEQEIRDLNKRISQITEQKTEMNKIIESYEFRISNSKKLKNEQQSDGKQRNALEQDIKNLKRELNIANSLNDKIINEKLLLQEKIKKKNNKIRMEKNKLRTANDLILEKSNLLLQLQLANGIHAPSVSTRMTYKGCKERERTIPCKTKKKIINRYRSDTILDNYERIKNKLFESNEKCYFLSKTNLELFKGLNIKKKKIDILNKKMSYLKYFMKAKEKLNNQHSHELKEYKNEVENSHNSDCSSEKEEIKKLICEKKEFTEVNEYEEHKLDNKQKERIKSLEKILNSITNEHNLLKKKYEMLYKKYLRLLKKNTCKNKDFTFIEKKKEDISPAVDVIHSFYLKKKENNLKKNYQRGNKLINYIKGKVIDKKHVRIGKFRNYKEYNDYGDIEFYISNQILRWININEITDIRYIYSYGNATGNLCTYIFIYV